MHCSSYLLWAVIADTEDALMVIIACSVQVLSTLSTKKESHTQAFHHVVTTFCYDLSTHVFFSFLTTLRVPLLRFFAAFFAMFPFLPPPPCKLNYVTSWYLFLMQ